MRVLVFAFLLCSLLCSTALSAPVNKIVAVVNGDMITSYDLNQACLMVLQRKGIDPKKAANADAVKEVRHNVLETLINDLIVSQEAARMQVNISDEAVEAEIKGGLERSKLSEDDLARQLATQKMTRDEYRETIRKNLVTRELLKHMVARKVIISEEEIAAYYNEHPEMFDAGRKVRFAVIIYPPEASPKAWNKRLQEGSISFEKAVRDISIGPMKDQGGELDWMSWSDLSPEVRSHLGSLQPGDISNIMLLNGMPAQLKLLDTQSGSERQPLEEVKEQIENILRQPKMHERFTEYMEQLRKKAVVDIRL